MKTAAAFASIASFVLAASFVGGCAVQQGAEDSTHANDEALIINTHAPTTPQQPSTGGSTVPSNGGVGGSGGGTGTAAPVCTPTVGVRYCTKQLIGELTITNEVSADTCGNWVSCGAFACDDATGVCLGQCASTNDCAAGFTCEGTQCVNTSGATLGPASSSGDSDLADIGYACFPKPPSCVGGNQVSPTSCYGVAMTHLCGAYACEANACKQTCATAGDCANGYVCNNGTAPVGECVIPAHAKEE